MATTLSAVGPTLLPNQIASPIFAKASETSAVMQQARQVQLALNVGTSIPVPMDVPQAGWVTEGGVKPASQVGIGVKQMTGKKVALLVPFSMEVAQTNPAGMYSQLVEQDAPTAIARAFDQAAINGTDSRTGGAGPFTDYLSRANNTVALGTTAAANGGLYIDLMTGVGKVVDKNFDMTGFVADPRLKVDAQLAVDSSGRPLFVDNTVTASPAVHGLQGGQLVGYPVSYGRGISGKYWRGGDTVQVVTINGTPTGGTFVLASGGNSATIAYNAAASTVQTAIQGWGYIYSSVTVSGSAGGPYTITFPAIASNVNSAVAPFTVDQRLLTGGTAAASKATIAKSGAGGVDSTIRGIGGDWSQCAYGVGMEITMRISDQANYYDGSAWHSAFQENLVLVLIEAYYGFVVGDYDAFVTYTKGSATF
jgi:hypothetical protein